MDPILAKLMTILHTRRRQPSPESSYTSQLFASGVTGIGDKVVEEAVEVVAAAQLPDPAARDAGIIYEVADTVYHLCVLLAYFGLNWSDVEQELERRFGRSGLEEKTSRTP
jgi:phosphoribosyl-ATP pyrophosphohydrolase